MLTNRIALAAALLAILCPAAVALAMNAYADHQEQREFTCVQHVRTSGVLGAAEAAADVCNTDYIKRYSR